MNTNKSCYLCKSEKIKKLEGSVRDNSSLQILQCENCSLVFLSSFSHICENFYENDGMFGGEVEIEKWLKQTKDDDLRRYAFLKKEIKNKKILDFGCGNGGFLSCAQKSASKAIGIDLQESMQDFYKMKNLTVFSDLKKVGEKFDFITMFHVLEHIKDPIDVLKKLMDKLEDNGEIIIEVPNANDALITIYNNHAFMNFTYWGCHLFLFNEKTLTEVIKKAGFKINYLKHVQRYGFSNHLWWQFMKKTGWAQKIVALEYRLLE